MVLNVTVIFLIYKLFIYARFADMIQKNMPKWLTHGGKRYMMSDINWVELGLMFLIVLAIILCVYLIVLIRNLNKSVRKIKDIIDKNEDNVNQVFKDLPVVSNNLIEITDVAKKEVKAVENAVNSVSETVSSTAAAASAFKNNVVGKIKTAVRVIEVARFILPKGKRKLK